jgi:hypothetical protein
VLRDCKSARKKWSTGDRADNFFFVKGAVKNKLIFKECKKCYYDPKNFFLEKYQYGYQKNAEFYADFKFVDAGFHKCT